MHCHQWRLPQTGLGRAGQHLCTLLQLRAWGVLFDRPVSINASKCSKISKISLTSWIPSSRSSSFCSQQGTAAALYTNQLTFTYDKAMQYEDSSEWSGFKFLLRLFSGSFEWVFLTSRNTKNMHFHSIYLDWTCSVERLSVTRFLWKCLLCILRYQIWNLSVAPAECQEDTSKDHSIITLRWMKNSGILLLKAVLMLFKIQHCSAPRWQKPKGVYDLTEPFHNVLA